MPKTMMTIYGTPNGTTTVHVQDVSKWPFERRLSTTLEITVPRLAPEAANQLGAMISPEAVATIAAVLLAWVVSHAFGLGEIIDIILGVVGAIAIGWAIFDAIDHLYDFAMGVQKATRVQDLHTAADHLAKAIAILGIQAVLAFLFKGAKRPKTNEGGRINLGPPPPAQGLRYQPKTTNNASLSRFVEGDTNFWGDIRLSWKLFGSNKDRVLLHEKVHRFLRPKVDVLRSYRASNQAASYTRSSLWRYLEEALAETIAQVGVNGFKQFFYGIRFPVKNQYMFLRQAGGFNSQLGGAGLIPELKGLVKTGTVSGVSFELYKYESNTMEKGDQWYEGLYKECFLGDSDIRKWVSGKTATQLAGIEPEMKASMVNRLLDGWVSDDDIKAIETLCLAINDLEEGSFMSGVINRRILDVTDLGQRTRIRLLCQRF
jgi:uncharacterized membrane protein YeaQ/YmgE (transglycosylase-associated protein family)